MIEMTLERDDVAEILAEAKRRADTAKQLGYGHGDPRPVNYSDHVRGAACEKMFAKWRGSRWPQDYSFGEYGDVDGYECRSTRYHTGHLIIYNSDEDKRPFVLVIVPDGDYPSYGRIVGWIWGDEGKWAGHPPDRDKVRGQIGVDTTIWVPQECLNHDMSAIKHKHADDLLRERW